MTTPLFSPRRALGRTGFVATILGIGDLADCQLSLQQLVATVRRALGLHTGLAPQLAAALQQVSLPGGSHPPLAGNQESSA